MTQVRLVETGLDDAGRSTVIGDRLVDARELPTGRVLNPLWSGDAVLDVAPGGAEPGLFPSAGGARFWLFTVRANEAQTGHALHRTATIDLGYIVSGVLTMELEDGSTVDLHPGDAYVQNATLHGWHNHADVDATVALVVLGK
jgi:quercetin dioxygenase-like cupin family protein